MSKTAWSRSSSVPSDRIPPSRTPTSNRNKGKGKAHEPPKSKEVVRLEGLVEGLIAWTGSKDPKGGCFCQAREHALSQYTPLCVKCGLVLCSLHKPFYACPHCASPLTSPSAREALIEKLTDEISEVMIREAEQREHKRQELQKAAGAFPTLAPSIGTPQLATAAAQPRKVLSLNAQTRKVTVASHVGPVRAPSAAEGKEEVEVRMPPPPTEVDYVRSRPVEGRRWENLRDGGMVYVPLPAPSAASEGSRGGRRRKKGAS